MTAIEQHSILNLSHSYLKFQVCLIDLCQSNIQILYSLQIDNGSVSAAAKLKFSRKSLRPTVNILDLLHRFSFQFIKNGSIAM